MTKLKAFLTAADALHLLLPTAPVSADPIKNIVLVHGAWVDASGWKPTGIRQQADHERRPFIPPERTPHRVTR
jgi:hypothetical protein